MRFYMLGDLNNDDSSCYDKTEGCTLRNVIIRRCHKEQAQRLLNKINEDLNKI